MNVIQKIFSGINDNEVHDALIKYGKGEFKSKYVLEGRRQKDKWVLKTSSEYANILVKEVLQDAEESVRVTGAIIATFPINEKELPITNLKQFMGIKQNVVDGEISKEALLKIIDKYPRAFFALSFITKNSELKIKAKAPKSAKPSTKTDAEPKADFCSLKTNSERIIKDIFFDGHQFESININHTIKIDDIDIPQNISDPVLVREKSVRIGKVIRSINIDGNVRKSEKEFRA